MWNNFFAFLEQSPTDFHQQNKTNMTEPPSATMLKHQSSMYWQNPEASSVDSLYLEDKTN